MRDCWSHVFTAVIVSNILSPTEIVASAGFPSELLMVESSLSPGSPFESEHPLQGFIQDFRVGGGGGGGIKCVRKHVTRAVMTFWKFNYILT